MTHMLSGQRLTRLKANKRAYDHYEKRKEAYRRFSEKLLVLARTAPEFAYWENEETRVEQVKNWILTIDQSVFGFQTSWMTADEIADSYARLVVGHEKG